MSHKIRRFLPHALLIVIAVACGPTLLSDPSFDLWCDGKLCKPWESSGKIERVPTWHEHDYGISLGEGASISQLSKEDKVECIELAVIADVSASAEVWLELDFLDDGTPDYEQLIPQSDWAELRYLIKTPNWYDSVRFRLRKAGKGRAVLAQIKANGASGCEGKAIELLERTTGTPCTEARECASAACETAFSSFLDICERVEGGCELLDLLFSDKVCSECGGDDDCESDEVCGTRIGGERPVRACVPRSGAPLGEFCNVDDECESGTCCYGACSECCPDADELDTEACGAGIVCSNAGYDAALAQVEPGSSDAAAMSQESSPPAELSAHALAWLCNGSEGMRDVGEPCSANADCASDACELPQAVCVAPCENLCAFFSPDAECGYERRLAGTCR